MIYWFMFALNLSFGFIATPSEPLLPTLVMQSPEHTIHSMPPSSLQQRRQNNLRPALLQVESLSYDEDNKSLFKSGLVQSFNLSFSRLGTEENVESGLLKQVHVCHDDYERVSKTSWIAFFKLESHTLNRHCKNVITKAKMAITNNASAVIFDVTLDKNVSKLLNKKHSIRLHRPVLIVRGRAAQKLHLIMQNYTDALASVRLPATELNFIQDTENVSMGHYGYWSLIASSIVIGCLSAAAVILLIKTLGTRHPIMHALKKMKLSTYSDVRNETCDTQCAICCDDYQPNEVVRLLPCLHFFHKKCVDRWLISKKTCPLCLLDVVSGITNQQTNRDNTTQSTTARSGQVVQSPATAHHAAVCAPSSVAPKSYRQFMSMSMPLTTSLTILSLQPSVSSTLSSPSSTTGHLAVGGSFSTDTFSVHSIRNSLPNRTPPTLSTAGVGSCASKPVRVSSSLDSLYLSNSSTHVSAFIFSSKHSNAICNANT